MRYKEVKVYKLPTDQGKEVNVVTLSSYNQILSKWRKQRALINQLQQQLPDSNTPSETDAIGSTPKDELELVDLSSSNSTENALQIIKGLELPKKIITYISKSLKILLPNLLTKSNSKLSVIVASQENSKKNSLIVEPLAVKSLTLSEITYNSKNKDFDKKDEEISVTTKKNPEQLTERIEEAEETPIETAQGTVSKNDFKSSAISLAKNVLNSSDEEEKKVNRIGNIKGIMSSYITLRLKGKKSTVSLTSNTIDQIKKDICDDFEQDIINSLQERASQLVFKQEKDKTNYDNFTTSISIAYSASGNLPKKEPTVEDKGTEMLITLYIPCTATFNTKRDARNIKNLANNLLDTVGDKAEHAGRRYLVDNWNSN